MQCANSYYLAQYEANQIDADKRAEWIETQAKVKFAEMMPMSRSNFEEAICESVYGPDEIKMLDAFNGQSDADLGKLIRAAVVSYYMDYCRNQAADEYDDGEQS